MFLGLDIDAKGAHYAHTDDGDKFTDGRITLEDFPALLTAHRVKFVAGEYTGRLAELWMLAAMEHGARGYILHSTERKAYTRIAGQSVKTDKRDAETIAFLLALWGDKEKVRIFRAANVLFADAEAVRKPWTLRALLNSTDKLTSQRTSAKVRLGAYTRVGNTHLTDLWTAAAESTLPDQAAQRSEDYARAEFGAELAIVQSIPGVGQRVGPYILGFLLPIERFAETDKRGQNRLRQNICKVAGLYPIVEDSASKTNQRKLSKRGNPRLRGMAYIAAQAAVRKGNNIFADYYTRQREKGYTHKKACVAVAIKLVSIAARMLEKGELFRDPNAIPKAFLPAHLITQSEAARRLGLSRARVGQMVHEAEIPSEEWRGKKYPSVSDIDALITKRRATPTKPKASTKPRPKKGQ